ncbi:hypothetical protein X556_0875, partial [Chlamydia pneumoniae B21]
TATTVTALSSDAQYVAKNIMDSVTTFFIIKISKKSNP